MARAGNAKILSFMKQEESLGHKNRKKGHVFQEWF